MLWISGLVTRHHRLAWTFIVLLTLATALAVTVLWRGERERERLALLSIRSSRMADEVMAQTLAGNLMGALQAIALLNEDAKRDARASDDFNGPAISRVLQTTGRAFGADGIYIVGKDFTIRSSWGEGPALTGVNVRFRPYAQVAAKGRDTIYPAIGTTTGRRTLYFATPLRDGEARDAQVIGAVVARVGLGKVDGLLASHDGIALLASPQGLVFAGGRAEWLGRMVRAPDPVLVEAIRTAKQFGTMFDNRDPAPLPFDLDSDFTEIEGERYAVFKVTLPWNDDHGDWSLYLLENLGRSISLRSILEIGAAGGTAMFLLLVLTLAVLRSYAAQAESTHRFQSLAHEQEAMAALKARLAAASLRMQRTADLADLCQVFLSEAHSLVDSLQGVVYVADKGSESCLRLAGSYGCHGSLPDMIYPGEGLLGQCALERRIMVIEKPEDRAWTIRSSLGESAPAALLLAPILLNNDLIGAVELGLLRAPEKPVVERFQELAEVFTFNLQIKRQTAGPEWHSEAAEVLT